MIKRISQRRSREKHSPGLGKQHLQRSQSEKGPGQYPKVRGALAKAGKIARGQTTQSLGGCAVKFAFYSKYHRKSLKLLNKNCQRNKTHYVCNSLHLYFKENVC